jgi:hypothetical protein
MNIPICPDHPNNPKVVKSEDEILHNFKLKAKATKYYCPECNKLLATYGDENWERISGEDRGSL